MVENTKSIPFLLIRSAISKSDFSPSKITKISFHGNFASKIAFIFFCTASFFLSKSFFKTAFLRSIISIFCGFFLPFSKISLVKSDHFINSQYSLYTDFLSKKTRKHEAQNPLPSCIIWPTYKPFASGTLYSADCKICINSASK